MPLTTSISAHFSLLSPVYSTILCVIYLYLHSRSLIRVSACPKRPKQNLESRMSLASPLQQQTPRPCRASHVFVAFAAFKVSNDLLGSGRNRRKLLYN